MSLERLRIIVDAVAGGAVRDLEAVGATATKVGAQTSAMNAKSGTAATGFNALGGTATKVAGVVAIAGVAAFKAASEYAELGDKVRKFRDIAGVTTETASRWVAVMDDFGIASETGGRGMRNLATETNNGGQKLREFGVEVAYAKNGSVDLQGTVLNVADAYKKMNDPAARAELLAAAFGKRVGTELIPILEQGREGVERLFADVPNGQILDDADLARAREFKLAMDDLEDAAQEMVIAFGGLAAGPISSVATGLATVVRGIVDVNDATHGLALGPLALGMDSLGVGAGGVADILEQKMVKQLANSKRGSDEYSEALRFLKQAHSDALPPTGALAEGTKRFGEEVQAEIAGVKAATAALYEKINAELAAQGSVLAVESAQKAYDEALYLHGPASLEARQAELNLEVATVRAGQATDGNKKAQQELAAIFGTLPPKVQALITKLGMIPPKKATWVEAHTEQATRDIDNWIAAQNRKKVQIYVQSGGPTYFGPPLQTGGPVPGPVGAPYPITAHGGEFVLSADVVRAIKRGGITEGLGRSPGSVAGVGGAPVQVIVDMTGATVLGGNARAIARSIGDEVHRVLLDKQNSGSLGFTSP